MRDVRIAGWRIFFVTLFCSLIAACMLAATWVIFDLIDMAVGLFWRTLSFSAQSPVAVIIASILISIMVVTIYVIAKERGQRNG